jgi:hypothetical protein
MVSCYLIWKGCLHCLWLKQLTKGMEYIGTSICFPISISCELPTTSIAKPTSRVKKLQWVHSCHKVPCRSIGYCWKANKGWRAHLLYCGRLEPTIQSFCNIFLIFAKEWFNDSRIISIWALKLWTTAWELECCFWSQLIYHIFIKANQFQKQTEVWKPVTLQSTKVFECLTKLKPKEIIQFCRQSNVR